MCTSLRTVLGLVIVLGQLALVSGCGGHSGTPTAPSASPATASSPAPAPIAPGATIIGTVASISSPPAGLVVGVAGTTASSVSDAGGNFALNNVPPADVVLTFSAPGVSASAPVGVVGVNDLVQVTVTVSATGATIESQQRTAPDNMVDAEGVLVDPDVAGRQFRLGSTFVQVTASAVIKRLDAPVGFGDLKNGDRVRVHGVKDGTVIRASEVLASPAPTPTPTPTPVPTPTPGPAAPATITGTIASLGGTCPALSLSMNGTLVKTTSATTFTGRACAEIRSGDAAQAVGPKQADGSVLAEKLYVSPAAPAPSPTPTPVPDVTLNGAIVSLGGTCPALSMSVAGTGVKTNPATVFNNKPCAELKNGDTVYAIGPKQSDGSLLATKVTYSGPPPATDATLKGAIGSLGGTCPALSMSVAGSLVKTNSATVFNVRSCAELKSGDTVYAIGPKQSDNSVLASKIYYVAPTPVDVTVTGALSALTGTCPAVSMTVAGTVVRTSSSTTYSGKGCTVLQNGDAVSAVGSKQSDGSVLAARMEATSSTASVYANGTVSSLSGACPSLALNISGVVVKTNAATVFSGKACADIASGSTLNSSSTRQTDGSLLANYVQVVK